MIHFSKTYVAAALILAVVAAVSVTVISVAGSSNTDEAAPALASHSDPHPHPHSHPHAVGSADGPGVDGDTMVALNFDGTFARSIGELTDTADVIVKGRVARVAGVINTAMNPDDPSQPHAEVFGLGRIYEIEVDERFKGEVPGRLTLVQNEGYFDIGELSEKQLENPSSIESVGNVDTVKPGVDYVFFLRSVDSELARYAAPSYPYRFALVEGKAEPEGNLKEEWSAFAGADAESLLGQLRTLSN